MLTLLYYLNYYKITSWYYYSQKYKAFNSIKIVLSFIVKVRIICNHFLTFKAVYKENKF